MLNERVKADCSQSAIQASASQGGSLMVNLKKMFFILVCVAVAAFSSIKAYAATDVNDARAFFDGFITSLNTYNANVPSYYTQDAKIYRVVIKKDGTKQTVQVPMERYANELQKGRAGAKLIGYKNRFENIVVTKKDDITYKVTAKRYPMYDKKGLAAEYVIVDTGSGFKIKSESWETTVQKFLHEK